MLLGQSAVSTSVRPTCESPMCDKVREVSCQHHQYSVSSANYHLGSLRLNLCQISVPDWGDHGHRRYDRDAYYSPHLCTDMQSQLISHQMPC